MEVVVARGARGEGRLQADHGRQSNRLLRLLPREYHAAMLGTTRPWQSRLGQVRVE
jgi:hypothetical protein